MALIDSLVKEDFASLKGFIDGGDNDWKKVKSIMCYWLNAEEGIKDHFPTTKTAVEEMFCARTNDGNHYDNPFMVTDTVRDQMNATKERNLQKKQKMLAEIDELTLDSCPPEILEMIRSRLPVSDDAELLNMVKQLMYTNIEGQDADELEEVHTGASSGGRFLDQKFLSDVNAILPPQGCAGDLYDQIWEEEYDSKKFQALFDKAKMDVKSSWKVNRTMFDPRWSKFKEGQIPPNKYNPIADIGTQFLYACGVLEYLQSSVNEIKAMTFFQCTSLYFWNVSRALVDLISAGSLSIELNIGSVIDLGRSIQQDSNSRRKFHRIFVSNIPDYIGQTAIFTEIAPILHLPTKTMPSFIQSNVLYNTQIWQNYSHYIYSATGIPTLDDAAKMLGLEYITQDNVWSHHNQWTWLNKASPTKASRAELTQWLHRLLLFALLPPKRDSYNNCMEMFSMNVAAFMRVCVFCVETLEYPAHRIGGILDDVVSACSKGTLKTTAEIPFISPVAYRASTKVNQIAMKSFQLELLSQIDI